MAHAAPTNGTQTLENLLGGTFARKAAITVLGSLFLAAMSQVAVGWPVPTTLQTLAVILIGLTFGFRLATATIALYLIEGVLGLPVFAQFKPLMPLGPTAGYLVGFFFQVAIISFLVDRGYARGFVGAAIAVVIGEVVMFTCGALWLSTMMGQPTFAENFNAALAAGVYPFVAIDLIKAALAIVIGMGVIKGASRLAQL